MIRSWIVSTSLLFYLPSVSGQTLGDYMSGAVPHSATASPSGLPRNPSNPPSVRMREHVNDCWGVGKFNDKTSSCERMDGPSIPQRMAQEASECEAKSPFKAQCTLAGCTCTASLSEVECTRGGAAFRNGTCFNDDPRNVSDRGDEDDVSKKEESINTCVSELSQAQSACEFAATATSNPQADKMLSSFKLDGSVANNCQQAKSMSQSMISMQTMFVANCKRVQVTCISACSDAVEKLKILGRSDDALSAHQRLSTCQSYSNTLNQISQQIAQYSQALTSAQNCEAMASNAGGTALTSGSLNCQGAQAAKDPRCQTIAQASVENCSDPACICRKNPALCQAQVQAAVQTASATTYDDMTANEKAAYIQTQYADTQARINNILAKEEEREKQANAQASGQNSLGGWVRSFFGGSSDAPPAPIAPPSPKPRVQQDQKYSLGFSSGGGGSYRVISGAGSAQSAPPQAPSAQPVVTTSSESAPTFSIMDKFKRWLGIKRSSQVSRNLQLHVQDNDRYGVDRFPSSFEEQKIKEQTHRDWLAMLFGTIIVGSLSAAFIVWRKDDKNSPTSRL